MKQGRTLSELANELERQTAAKRDFISPTNKLDVMFSAAGAASLVVDNAESFALTHHAQRQVGKRTKVPAKFWDMMAEGTPREREALSEVVNARLHEHPEKRMVRTLDGSARAFLSDRYRILDNQQLAEIVLPALSEIAVDSGLNIASCEITERKMYLKFIFPKVRAEVGLGDVVEAGAIIRNSEIGVGTLSIFPFVHRLVCLNGMVVGDHGMRKFHLGRGHGAKDEQAAYELFTDETLRADDKAFWLKTRDVLAQLTRQETFDQIVNSMRDAADRPVADPIAAVEVVQDRYTLSDSQSRGILTHLASGGDLSQWGMVNAITRYSQDVESYDEATDLEALGGRVLDLKPTQWRTIGEAVAA